MSINNNPNAQKVRPNKSSPKTPRKLQLWTNQSKTKYAVRLEGELPYLATTDPEVVQYTTLLAESDRIFKGYEYDWKYILNKWIGIYKFAMGYRKRSKFLFSSMTSPSNRSEDRRSSFYATATDGNKYSVILKPYIKCHFCKLLFESNKKRTKHEREWHSK